MAWFKNLKESSEQCLEKQDDQTIKPRTDEDAFGGAVPEGINIIGKDKGVSDERYAK
jgi:hypothetical protein